MSSVFFSFLVYSLVFIKKYINLNYFVYFNSIWLLIDCLIFKFKNSLFRGPVTFVVLFFVDYDSLFHLE